MFVFVLKHPIYDNATTFQKPEENIKLESGIRQENSISPKTFSLSLEDTFQTWEWENKGLTIDDENINLRFVVDVALLAKDREELQEMTLNLNTISKEIELKIKLAENKNLINNLWI